MLKLRFSVIFGVTLYLADVKASHPSSRPRCRISCQRRGPSTDRYNFRVHASTFGDTCDRRADLQRSVSVSVSVSLSVKQVSSHNRSTSSPSSLSSQLNYVVGVTRSFPSIAIHPPSSSMLVVLLFLAHSISHGVKLMYKLEPRLMEAPIIRHAAAAVCCAAGTRVLTVDHN